ncbi:hypothetical protein L596_010673 [Steinernema carpocapsae]|uniref:Uncharacterized protein n=1 Tax=Steinernema carpocapsae TaxID=34508 RepID=A0A4U5PJB3_STECR|nr:hypothetical protein L596_010673 [Steinernema carpocapsae]
MVLQRLTPLMHHTKNKKVPIVNESYTSEDKQEEADVEDDIEKLWVDSVVLKRWFLLKCFLDMSFNEVFILFAAWKVQ